MRNYDALFEICTELCLLSQYSNKAIDPNILQEREELQSLFYGLKAVSYQAKQIILTKDPENQASSKGNVHDIAARTSRIEELQEVDKFPAHNRQAQHGWITDVLYDIAEYAREYQLQELSAQMDKLADFFATQLKVSGSSTSARITLVGSAANHISLWNTEN